MVAITVNYGVPAAAQLDPGKPITTTIGNQYADSINFLKEWLGQSYTAGAVQDHNHDGVNSALIQIGANSLRNGSNEEGDNGWTYSPFTGGTVARGTSASQHGKYGLEITSTSLANGGGEAITDAYEPVGGGEVIPLRVWRHASAAGVSCKVELEFYDAAQALISTALVFQDTSTPTSATYYSGTITAPSTARFARFKLTGGVPGVGSATGTVYFSGSFMTGFPIITQGLLGSASVGQAELKSATTNGSVSQSTGGTMWYTLTGGTHSWWTGGGSGDISWKGGNSPAGTIGINVESDVLSYFYVDERYVTATQPYNTGDGDYGLVMYVLLDRNANILGTRIGPDPMWAYNGPTNIAAEWTQNGVGYRLEKRCIVEEYQGKINIATALRDPARRQQMLDYISGAGCERVPLAITHAIKNRDMNRFPHPFVGQDLTGKTVVMLDPVSNLAHQLLEVHEQGEVNIRDEFLLAGALKIDNTPLSRSGPNGVMQVAVSWK